MSTPEQRQVDAYLETVKRIEPNITMIDQDYTLASIAISLKRIADAIEAPYEYGFAYALAQAFVNAFGRR